MASFDGSDVCRQQPMRNCDIMTCDNGSFRTLTKGSMEVWEKLGDIFMQTGNYRNQRGWEKSLKAFLALFGL